MRKYHIYVRKDKSCYSLASNVCPERKKSKKPISGLYIEISFNERTGEVFISKDLFKG